MAIGDEHTITVGAYEKVLVEVNGDGDVGDAVAPYQLGLMTDAPLAAETAEGATSRSGISLFKRIVNKLIDLKALLTTIDGKITACNTGAVILAAPTDGTYIGDVKAPLDAYNLVPNDMQADQALTVDATAGGVQFSAFHADTTHVEFDIQTADVRVTFDDSAPTSTNGHLLPVGYQDTWSKAKASAAKFIRTGATSAVVHASQFKGA